MASLETRTLEVIDRCYAGVLDDTSWHGAIVALADLVGGTGTFVFAMQPSTQSVKRYDIARLDRSAFALYEKYWSAYDIRVPPGLHTAVGSPQTEETLGVSRTLRQSAIYNDYLYQNDMVHMAAQVS